MSPINKTNTHSSYTAAQDSNKKNSDCDFGTVKNDPITRYTFWLMIFTGLLVVCNLLLWLYTRKIAKAAKISADVLPTIEKAYVYAAIIIPIKDLLASMIFLLKLKYGIMVKLQPL